MRSWDTYISLEATVKNMLTSLKAVGELQNSAIRERHWRQLMNSTKVSILLIINRKCACFQCFFFSFSVNNLFVSVFLSCSTFSCSYPQSQNVFTELETLVLQLCKKI